MHFSVEIVTRNVDYTRFRRAFNSEQFNQEVAQSANLKERVLLEQVKQPDGKERKRIRVVPNVSLPAAIQRFFKNGQLSYEEITVFDAAARAATFTLEVSGVDGIHVSGNARYIEEPEGVRLAVEGNATVKIFGVGSLVERHLIGEMTARYKLVEELLQAFVDEGRDANLTPSLPVPP